jgi:hypothetical protein
MGEKPDYQSFPIIPPRFPIVPDRRASGSQTGHSGGSTCCSSASSSYLVFKRRLRSHLDPRCLPNGIIWKLLRSSVRNLDLALVLSVSSLARRAPRVLGGRCPSDEFERTVGALLVEAHGCSLHHLGHLTLQGVRVAWTMVRWSAGLSVRSRRANATSTSHDSSTSRAVSR